MALVQGREAINQGRAENYVESDLNKKSTIISANNVTYKGDEMVIKNEIVVPAIEQQVAYKIEEAFTSDAKVPAQVVAPKDQATPIMVQKIEDRKDVTILAPLKSGKRKIVDKLGEVSNIDEEVEACILRYVSALDAYDNTKKIREDYDTAVNELVELVGLDFYFDDPTTGTVFKTLVPKGRFVEYKHADVAYTKRDHLGEKKGILSQKEVQDKGFLLSERV